MVQKIWNGDIMPTPKLFEQMSGGIASPDTLNQWLKALVPVEAKSKDFFTQPSAAWLASVQSMLKGSDTLRHMQIDAIHNTQKRAARLAASLAHASGPLDAGKAWQQFSQDNLQNTMEYWTAYSEILQDTDIKVLNQAENSIRQDSNDKEPTARLVNPAKRRSTPRARARRK